MLIEEYESRLQQVEQNLTKECLHEKNERDAFKTKVCDDQMQELKNDLFERKKKTIIELDTQWRKKLKTLKNQLEDEQSKKCESEKSRILSVEKEQCIVKTQKLKQVHKNDLDEKIDLTEELKISLSS